MEKASVVLLQTPFLYYMLLYDFLLFCQPDYFQLCFIHPAFFQFQRILHFFISTFYIQIILMFLTVIPLPESPIILLILYITIIPLSVYFHTLEHNSTLVLYCQLTSLGKKEHPKRTLFSVKVFIWQSIP